MEYRGTYVFEGRFNGDLTRTQIARILYRWQLDRVARHATFIITPSLETQVPAHVRRRHPQAVIVDWPAFAERNNAFFSNVPNQMRPRYPRPGLPPLTT